jgi:hypothetical protein
MEIKQNAVIEVNLSLQKKPPISTAIYEKTLKVTGRSIEV